MVEGSLPSYSKSSPGGGGGGVFRPVFLLGLYMFLVGLGSDIGLDAFDIAKD
jgi:hypothetical protein